MDQTVWNSLHGRIFEFTNPDSAHSVSRLAFHADFILILLSPLYLIWNDPRTLLFVQSFVLGLGAYFVYKIADKILNNQNLALVFSVSFLLNPFVQKQNLFDFHAITLATTFLLAAFYFILASKHKYVLLFLGLAVFTKENVYIIAALLGGYLFYLTRNKKWLYLSLGSLTILYLLVSIFIPGARGSEHFALEYFQDFGQSPSQILKSMITNPVSTISRFFDPESLNYLYTLLLPLGFTSLLAPIFLVFAAPDLGINLLSGNDNFRSLTFHYAAAIIPFIYISSIFGIRFLLKLKVEYINKASMIFILAIFTAISAYYYGVLPGAKRPSLEIYTRVLPQRSEMKEFMSRIDENLKVSASNNLGAHLSHREHLYTLPAGVNEADIVIFLLNDSYAAPSLESQVELANSLKYNPNYIEVANIGDFRAYAKRDKAGLIRQETSK